MGPILFAENEDSFTWNVVDRLPAAREEIELVRGADLARAPGRLRGARALVIGPGPRDPASAGLLGLVLAAARIGLPTLGICLGHQAIGVAFAARLARVPPRHGKTSVARFAPSRLFPGVEGDEVVMRYNSLALVDVPPPLRVVARSDDGIVMALEHEGLPIAGLQFHPDSHATLEGERILGAFFRAVA